jgi:hypothetical protein
MSREKACRLFWYMVPVVTIVFGKHNEKTSVPIIITSLLISITMGLTLGLAMARITQSFTMLIR